jgi:phosphoglycolate phosphatase
LGSSAPLVLFDLDGTLIDSAPGIFATLAHAFAEVGAELPPHDVLRGWIGPPFRQTFPTVLGEDSALIETAIEHYRLRFEAAGWREHTVYPGIAALVGALAHAAVPLAIVTTKPQHQAERILAHLPFGSAFARVYGADIASQHCAKAAMIGQALADFGVDARDATMVGDRHFDMAGARANDVRALGVAWGFGSREELESAGAECIAGDPVELGRLLGLA